MIIRDMIARGIKGIAISTVGSPEIKTALEEAIERGVEVVCYDADMPEVARKAFIGIDNAEMGEVLARATAKLIGGQGTVICAVSTLSQHNIAMRATGFHAYLEGIGVRVLLADGAGDPDIEHRYETVEALVKGNPDCKAIAVCDGRGFPLKSMIQERLHVDLKTAVVDKKPETMDLLEKGKVDVIVAQRFELYGELSVRRLVEILMGQTVPPSENTGVYEITRAAL